MTTEIFGRSTSHFTRVVRMFALELGVQAQLVPIYDLADLEPSVYGANPALRMPVLRHGQRVVFGTENGCRLLCELAAASQDVVMPEHARSDLTRNAHELMWQSMSNQVSILMGERVGKLDPSNIYFVKLRQGLSGALAWLDENLDEVITSLPSTRRLSLFEVALFCLLEHLKFRTTVAFEHHPALTGFVSSFAARESALVTPYVVDARPNE